MVAPDCNMDKKLKNLFMQNFSKIKKRQWSLSHENAHIKRIIQFHKVDHEKNKFETLLLRARSNLDLQRQWLTAYHWAMMRRLFLKYCLKRTIIRVFTFVHLFRKKTNSHPFIHRHQCCPKAYIPYRTNNFLKTVKM